MAVYQNVNGVIREVKNIYENVNGVIRQVNARYQNVNGVIRQTYGVINGTIVNTSQNLYKYVYSDTASYMVYPNYAYITKMPEQIKTYNQKFRINIPAQSFSFISTSEVDSTRYWFPTNSALTSCKVFSMYVTDESATKQSVYSVSDTFDWVVSQTVVKLSSSSYKYTVNIPAVTTPWCNMRYSSETYGINYFVIGHLFNNTRYAGLYQTSPGWDNMKVYIEIASI